MKQAADSSTIDMFPTSKRRGRPSTGKAKSSAERQAKYRMLKNDCSEQVNLNLWLDRRAKAALARLAAHSSVTPAVMLQQLLLQTEQELCSQLIIESAESLDKYWGVKVELTGVQDAPKEQEDLCEVTLNSVDPLVLFARNIVKCSPKYIHPEKGELTWSGRGVRPDWVTQLLNEGFSLDDFRI